MFFDAIARTCCGRGNQRGSLVGAVQLFPDLLAEALGSGEPRGRVVPAGRVQLGHTLGGVRPSHRRVRVGRRRVERGLAGTTAADGRGRRVVEPEFATVVVAGRRQLGHAAGHPLAVRRRGRPGRGQRQPRHVLQLQGLAALALQDCTDVFAVTAPRLGQLVQACHREGPTWVPKFCFFFHCSGAHAVERG